jgi:hypothetical protein
VDKIEGPIINDEDGQRDSDDYDRNNSTENYYHQDSIPNQSTMSKRGSQTV